MFKSIDVEFYKNGYNVSQINCLDLPIAGAAGCYNADNYFFYCFYRSLLHNWLQNGKEKRPDFFSEFLESRNIILNKLGLTLKPEKVEAPSEIIPLIKYHIHNGHPIVLFVYYKYIFFDRNYMNDVDGRWLHAILVNEYNAETSVIGIRDCTIARDEIQPEIIGDALFRLRLKEDMLLDMWEKSNEFMKVDRPALCNSILSLEKICEPSIKSYDDLVEDFLKNYNFSTCKLADMVENFSSNINEIKSQWTRREVYGSLEALFRAFEKSSHFQEQDSKNRIDFLEFKKKYMGCRSKSLTKLHLHSIKNKDLDVNERKSIIEDITLMDNELVSHVSKLCSRKESFNQGGSVNNFISLDLSRYFNNKGFGPLSDSSKADLTQRGEYFVTDGLPQENEWNISDMKFKFPDITESGYDNISCDSQTVSINAGQYKKLMMLGCSEWGNHSGILTVEYSDGEKEELNISLSDWSNVPAGDEKRVWTGHAASRTNEVVTPRDFTVSIFAKQYLLNDKKSAVSLTLPDCSNIHLFAITLF